MTPRRHPRPRVPPRARPDRPGRAWPGRGTGTRPGRRSWPGWRRVGRARAVWSALPGGHWPGEIAAAAAAAAGAGRGVVIVVPDARDLDRVDAALAAALGPGGHVILAASLGPAERYRRWLAAARGQVRVAAGTRSAMFAPVRDLGLVVLWDEGDDLLAEPRAPYPHAREVLALRAHRAGAAALIGGFARTAEAALLVAGGWARPLAADRATVRRWAPAVVAPGEDRELARDEAARSARLPGLALRTAREALDRGPVLFQVPRSGYLAAVACERCHAPVRCQCGGPAQLSGARAAPQLRLVRQRRSAGPAPGAGTPDCAPWSPGRPGPPRNWAGRSRRGPCAPPAAAGSWPACRAPRRWWWPRRAPSRTPTAGTPPPCCSTPGRCWAAPACGPARRRCAGG